MPVYSEVEPSRFHYDFFQQTMSEQAKKIHEYDLETQYDLYIVGQQVIHPPMMLDDELAKNGKAIVPLLREKLASPPKYEATVRDIVQVLDQMARQKTYDVRNDNALIALAEKRVSEMKGYWKSYTQEMLDDIRNNFPVHSEVKPTDFHWDFFKQTTLQQANKIHDYDLETQYDLFIVGQQAIQSPMIFLADELAKNGEAIVPLLREKLASPPKYEATVRDIVLVLNQMARQKTYDVRNDKVLMALVEKRVSAMKGLWEPITQGRLDEIRSSKFD